MAMNKSQSDRSTSRISFAALLIGNVLSLTTTALGDFWLFDDFEDESIGAINGQDDWVSSGGDNRVVIDPADPSNQVLYVPSSSSVLRKSLLVADLGIMNGTARMMFLRMRVANKQTFSVGLSPYTNPSEYSDFATELGMANSAPNLDLRVWDNDGGNYEVLTQLTADTWYNVWILVDAQLNESQVWLNSAGHFASVEDQLAATDGDLTFQFRSGAASNLVTFYIKTSGGSSGFGPVYFDDIHIETVDSVNRCNPTNPPNGDCNEDGLVNLADIEPFVAILLDPAGAPYDPQNADLNCDGFADGRDIQLFVDRLIL